ncbi:MAG: glycosyltransferase family 2 protein [Rikenellaceae bacterium]
MDISVIVPIYGVERYIERCLRSLFTQSKTNGVEFVLVNDCTQDRSFEVAKAIVGEYSELNVVLVDKKCNEGLAKARLTGVESSSGDYIIHIDSDDWCERTMLEDLWAEVQESHSDIIICDFHIDSHRGHEYVSAELSQDNFECVNIMMKSAILGSVWNKLFKRQLYVKANFSLNERINMWEDMLLCSALFCYAEKISYLPMAYLHYVRGGGHCITYNIGMKTFKEMLRVVVIVEQFFKERNLYAKISRSLLIRKAELKFMILEYYSDKRNRLAGWQDHLILYPELKVQILHLNEVSMSKRVCLYLTNIGRGELFYFVNSVRRFVIKILSSLK